MPSDFAGSAKASMDLVRAFKLSMRRLASTVSVVTCSVDDQRFGMAATSVTSLTAEPPSILLCVNRESSISAPLNRAKTFCINLLRAEHVDVAAAFGGGLKGEQRFTVGAWQSDDHGIPYLRDAQTNLFCSLSDSIDYQTHRIVIGMVHKVELNGDVHPLVYQDGGYFGTKKLNTILNLKNSIEISSCAVFM